MLLADGRWRGTHGIGRFATEVLNRLPEHLEVNPKISFLGTLEPLQLTVEILKQKPSIYFTPGFNPPLYAPCPVVLTLHDLIHVEVLEEATRAKKLYYQYIVKPAVHKAKAVLTVSEFSKERIIQWANVPEHKIAVVGNGVDSQYQPTGDVYQPNYDYILYIGNQKPHKNIPRLLEAFAQLKTDVKLLFSGQVAEDIAAHIERLGLQTRVVFAGLIPEEDLPKYYRGAKALVLPSLYEGFGLPPLEAMACGTPVVVAKSTSIPEVVGDAGLYFNPLDVNDMARALHEILNNADLRERLKIKGLEQSSKFSWDQVAERIRVHLQ